jgi:uncharacterized protein (TIGR03000 family)
MLRRLLTTAGVLGLGVAGFVLTAGPAAAQQGWQFYGGAGRPGYSAPAAAGYTYTNGYGSSGYNSDYSYGARVFSAPAYSYGSFSPEQTAAYYGSEAEGRGAIIDVRLPAEAAILFDGRQTSATGPERRFLSPPLTPGKEYVYEVSVRWHEGGREVTRTRSLPVRAGERLNVTFVAEATR